MSEKYILDGHNPVLCDDLLKWAEWYETADRTVLKTPLPNGIRVSTVFLGLNHNFGRGKPILFETMVFGGKLDEKQKRYRTWEEAEIGHKATVAEVIAIEKMKISRIAKQG